jgi:hypothetical protein
MTCYVCHKEIVPRKINAAKYDPKHLQTFAALYEGQLVRRSDLPVNIGRDMYRHEGCEAGSPKWMKGQASMKKKARSEFYDIVKEIENNS